MNRLSLGLIAVSMALLGMSFLPAGASASPGWINRCPYSHSLKDDPVVFPDDVGASHLHDFFGAKDTRATSTYRSMRRGGTTCVPHDTAGYWVPALYEDGHRILAKGGATRQQLYYRDSNLRAGTHVRAYPRGMQLIAGDSHARSIRGNRELGEEIYWGCSDNQPEGKFTQPIDCSTGIMTLHVGFPNCWDGKHLSMARVPGAVVYPEDGMCPASHPIALPRLIARFEYPVGKMTGHIRLSSGPAFTIHGDFWNTWKQHALQELVVRCLNADRDCGSFPRT
ncbi:MAG: DUF1996 domain-containing protein [Actinomycetota bacterium]